ncbi:MAG TPA: 3-dehydroquinate synthase [Candidatus Omnitrophota bacterium]|nr:3-dehydroquinate synthase [Candidatus Omnitrophota bacterium]HPS36139.1 3-dehydroquinate synthase [Candidatus Omnitrophota bacterium]
MKTIPVRSLKGNYNILVGRGLLGRAGALVAGLFAPGARIMIVSQKNLAAYVKKVATSLSQKGFTVQTHTLPDGEVAKSGPELFRLCHTLLAQGFERKDGIVVVGGGVVSDLAGFAAAVYLRGIRYVNIATTLLAQVDSSIGGKTAIDLKEGKNLLGAFWPPALVISDVEVLKSLPVRELSASLGEAVKYGMIRSPQLFNFLVKNSAKILRKDLGVLEKIVVVSAGIKAGVVSRDEFETKGERMILNYGHTFAHGIEGASAYQKIVHGEAVAIGMMMAAQLAGELGLCPRDLVWKQMRLILSLKLPVSIKNLNLSAAAIIKAMMRDKKKTGGSLRFILPRRIGQVTAEKNISLKLAEKILRHAGAK